MSERERERGGEREQLSVEGIEGLSVGRSRGAVAEAAALHV